MQPQLYKINLLLYFFIFTSIVKLYSTDIQDDSWVASEVLITRNDSDFKVVYYHDKMGHKVLATSYEKQDGTIFKPVSQSEWIYEGSQLNVVFQKSYLNNAFQIINKKVYAYENQQLNSISEYNSNNMLIHLTSYLYTDLKNYKISEYQRIEESLQLMKEHAYVSNKDTVIETENIYNDGVIKVQNQYLKIYNSDSSLKSLQFSTGDPGSLNKKELTKFTYTPKAKIASIRTLHWVSLINNWENFQKTDYIYTSFGQLESECLSVWESRFWKDKFRNFYQYNMDETLKSRSQQISLFQKWRNISTIDYEITNETLSATSSEEFWGGTEGKSLNSDIPVAIKDLNILVNAASVVVNFVKTSSSTINSKSVYFYPNPSNGVVYLNSMQNIPENVSIYSENGILISNQNLNSGVLNATFLPEGNYILQFVNNSKLYTQKITIQK